MTRVTAADLFCGAGGTSTGLRQSCDAAGAQLDLDVDIIHWTGERSIAPAPKDGK